MSFVFEVNVEPQPPNGRRRRFYDASRGLATRHGGCAPAEPAMPCGIVRQASSNRRDISRCL